MYNRNRSQTERQIVDQAQQLCEAARTTDVGSRPTRRVIVAGVIPAKARRPKLTVSTNPNYRPTRVRRSEPGWGRLVGHEGMVRQAGAR